jgi:anti-sigma regulatory factor (Ser/Thr protein kinase)
VTQERILIDLPWEISASRIARDALGRWGANPEAAVVVSELVTNALRHGAPPISLVTERTAETFRISVHDERRDMGALAPDSLGLRLVEAFSARWGISHVNDDGKCVWAEFSA